MREKKDEEMRNSIIKAFACEFNRVGPSLTIDSVRISLRISKKTIYRYFESKRDIYLAIIDRSTDYIKERQKEILGSDTPYSEKVREMLTIENPVQSSLRFRYVCDLKDKEPEIYDYLLERTFQTWNSILTLLEEGRKIGKVKEWVEPQFAFRVLTSSMLGVLRFGGLNDPEITYHDAVTVVASIFLEGILL